MANNRIYLRCKGCGDVLFLGKTFLDGYYWDPYGGKPLEDRLNEFYDKHNYCTNPKSDRTPYDEHLFPLPEGFDGCDGAFDIVYENNEGTGIEGPVAAVPVVRCGECKHYLDTLWIRERCGLKDIPVDKNDYCADGERKEKEK